MDTLVQHAILLIKNHMYVNSKRLSGNSIYLKRNLNSGISISKEKET
jgi:hypothetical protein